MDGIFNVAVAEFAEISSDGEIQSSPAGEKMSGWTVNYLREVLGGDQNLQIWPNQGNLFTRRDVPLVEPDAVEKYASDIDADLLLYGYVDTRISPPQLVLNFWVAPQNEYKFEDIQGNMQIGIPIRVADLDDPGLDVQGELERQSAAAAWIAMGLANEQLGQNEDALKAFEKAAGEVSRSEVVQFFIGRENLFLSESQPDEREEYLQKAEDAFLKATELNPQYARAYIGLGGVYRKRSADLVEKAQGSNQAPDPQAAEWAKQAIDAYQKILELKPDPAEYGVPIEDVARLGLGNAYQLQGRISLLQGDVDSALQAFDTSIQFLEDARPVFESAADEHASYRRYLTQAYEYLGTVHLWQGLAFETAQDYDSALTAYEASINAFDQCIAQANGSPDLVIQNEIVEKNCRPTLEKVQQIYDELKGGQ
jgi:tetratricopeptide (TPR) repeat protein